MKTKENSKKTNFTKLTRSGISLIVLVITIIVIIILAAAIILSLNNNNPIMEANTARYESDRANMQAVFTNTVAKIMAKNQATLTVSPGQINTITGGQKEVEGEVAYTLTDAQNESNSTGTIVFDKQISKDTVFYTGKKLPIYAAGETKWCVDEEGNISLEVAGIKYGSSETLDVEVSGPKPATFGEAYAMFSEDDGSLTFIRAETEPIVGETYDGKIISNVYSGFETETYEYNPYWEGWLCSTPWLEVYGMSSKIKSVNFKDVIKPISTAAWFVCLSNCTSFELKNLDTSNVTDMNRMFVSCNSADLDLSTFNTSKVTNMSEMFRYFGDKLDTATIKGLEKWDTSNVTNMEGMFSYFGFSAQTISLNLSSWNVSNVTNMSYMFSQCRPLENLNISNWNTSNVTNMSGMFSDAGREVQTFSLDLSSWNVSNVEKMEFMFYCTGYNAQTFELNLNGWKEQLKAGIKKTYMFSDTGKTAGFVAPF